MTDYSANVHLRLACTERGEISWADAYRAMTIRCPICRADPTCFCSQLETYPPVDFHQKRVDAAKLTEESK